MAGNALARSVLAKAQGRGESAEDVYAAVADTFEGLDRFQRAWALGYLAHLVGRARDRNPHDAADGEEGAKLHRKWAEGWRDGKGGDFVELAKRVRDMRGD